MVFFATALLGVGFLTL